MAKIPGYIPLDPQTVAFQAVCLGAALQGERLVSEYIYDSKAKKAPKPNSKYWVENQKIICFALSHEMKKYLKRPIRFNTNDPAINSCWAVDQLAIYLWALDKLEQKPLVEVSFSKEDLCAKIPFQGNLNGFIDSAQLRSLEEMYLLEQVLDLYTYRIDLLDFGPEFDDHYKDRILKRGRKLFESGFLVRQPIDDLEYEGQQLGDMSTEALEELEEVVVRRTQALFFVFGKMRSKNSLSST